MKKISSLRWRFWTISSKSNAWLYFRLYLEDNGLKANSYGEIEKSRRLLGIEIYQYFQYNNGPARKFSKLLELEIILEKCEKWFLVQICFLRTNTVIRMWCYSYSGIDTGNAFTIRANMQLLLCKFDDNYSLTTYQGDCVYGWTMESGGIYSVPSNQAEMIG